MAELKITPGPWCQAGRFGQEVRRYWPDHEDELGGVDLIATVHRVRDERDANAQAIEAVPLYEDLRKAIIELRDAQRAYMDDRGNNEKGAVVAARAQDVDKALEVLNAALEKAGDA